MSRRFFERVRVRLAAVVLAAVFPIAVFAWCTSGDRVGLAVAGMVSVAAAWAVSEVVVIRAFSVLAAAAERLAPENTNPEDTLRAGNELGRVAGAVDRMARARAALVDELRQSHADLEQAYEETLRGLVRALDLRDHETEGHSWRVSEMTVRVARRLGIDGRDLVDTRRGALLHDIGKIGIPDSILLKPGPLTQHEWTVMRTHPILAFDILHPITYLRNALVIPYYHHERWDGTGYPQGAAGTSIPLPARVFAVVDVYDALTSARPYRPAWPVSRALQYIREQSRSHFDPLVVNAFLGLLAEAGGFTEA